MIPINHALMENCRHGNFIIFTDKHKCISTSTEIFHMLVFTCQVYHQIFVFTMIFIYCLVCYEDVLLSNLSTQQLSAKYYLVIQISLMSELINGSLLKVFNTSLSVPLIYFFLGPYYFNTRRQHSTLSVVKLSNMRFL